MIITLLVVIFFNVDIKNKILNNKYFINYKEKFSNIKENFNFDFDPYNKSDNINNVNNVNNVNEEIEPFKQDVVKLKDLYENIKEQIKKLN